MANPILGPSKVFFVMRNISTLLLALSILTHHQSEKHFWYLGTPWKPQVKWMKWVGFFPVPQHCSAWQLHYLVENTQKLSGSAKSAPLSRVATPQPFIIYFSTSFSSLLLKKVLFDLSLCCNRLLLSSLQLLTSPPRQPANHFASLGDIIVTTLHQ